jgi:hypothetical protein
MTKTTGAIYRSEITEQRKKDLKKLDEVKKTHRKKMVKVCNHPPTWVNEGAKIIDNYENGIHRT